MCFIGLLLLDVGKFTLGHRISQSIVTLVVLGLTAFYHTYLRTTYQRLFQRAMLNQAISTNDSRVKPGNSVSIEDLISKHDRGQSRSCVVENNRIYDPALFERTPLVWIPRDESGASEEIKHSFRRSVSGSLLAVSDEGAHLQRNGQIVCELQQHPEELGLGSSSLRR
jgi:hypothetical protein